MDCLWFDKEIITTAIIVKIGLFEWKTGLNWLSCTSSTRLGQIFKGIRDQILLSKALSNGRADKGHELFFFRNTYFLLGWVNIDISQIRINLNINNCNREASYHEFRAISIKNSTVKQEVFNITSVNENRDVVTICTGQLRETNISRNFKIKVRI